MALVLLSTLVERVGFYRMRDFFRSSSVGYTHQILVGYNQQILVRYKYRILVPPPKSFFLLLLSHLFGLFLYQCCYPHTPRYSVSAVCSIFVISINYCHLVNTWNGMECVASALVKVFYYLKT